MPYMTGLCIEISHRDDEKETLEFSVDDGMDEVVAKVTVKDLIKLRDHLTVFIEEDENEMVLSGFGKI